MADVSQTRKRAPIIAKKAAKRLCCQDLLDAFLLLQEAQKKKLCKKEMAFFALTPRERHLLKKVDENFLIVKGKC